jgi:hypothetical protein
LAHSLKESRAAAAPALPPADNVPVALENSAMRLYDNEVDPWMAAKLQPARSHTDAAPDATIDIDDVD